MKITINRVRDAESRRGGSNLAETAHKTAAHHARVDGVRRPPGVAGPRARQADAYNRQLAARNCKTLDIDAELARAQDPVQ
jgi:hypothetical protein